MAQIIAKQGSDHTFILIDQYDVIIAERVAGLNLNRAINELKAIAAEQGLVIDEPKAPRPHLCGVDDKQIQAERAFLAAQREYIRTGKRTQRSIGKGW